MYHNFFIGLRIGISTHDLTKRSTRASSRKRRKMNISTHDLTKRSTWKGAHTELELDISTHDLTKRSTGCQIVNIQIAKYFNSRPHEEVDSSFAAEMEVKIRISTHDLTKRSTTTSGYSSPVLQFQLTTSRRGRRQAV